MVTEVISGDYLRQNASRGWYQREFRERAGPAPDAHGTEPTTVWRGVFG